MELDSLKQVWEEIDVPAHAVSGSEVYDMTNVKSQTAVSIMKQNLRSELLLVIILFVGGAAFYLFSFGGRLNEISWFFISIVLLFCCYYYYKNRLLSSMQCVTCNVHTNLKIQLHSLEKYLKLYLVAGTAIVPIALTFVFIMLKTKFPALARLFGHTNENGTVQFEWTWILVVMMATFGIYLMNRWYLRKLYGKHIEQLKSLITEFENV
jgi:hypothetical protein